MIPIIMSAVTLLPILVKVTISGGAVELGVVVARKVAVVGGETIVCEVAVEADVPDVERWCWAGLMRRY